MKRDNLLFTCVFRLPEGRQNCRLSYCAMGNIFKGYELTMQFCRTIKTRSFVTHAWSPTKSVVLFRTFKMFFRKFITTSSESSVTIILFSAKVASEIQTVMVIISRVKLKKKTTDFEFKRTVRSLYNTANEMVWKRCLLNSECLVTTSSISKRWMETDWQRSKNLWHVFYI